VGGAEVAIVTTTLSTNLVTPLVALMAVIKRWNVPGEGEPEVESIKLEKTVPLDGTVTWLAESVAVTPVGSAPAILRFTTSLTPFTDSSEMSDVWVEGGCRDVGDAKIKKSMGLTARGEDPEMLPEIARIRVAP
jgi:hypothetical protein